MLIATPNALMCGNEIRRLKSERGYRRALLSWLRSGRFIHMTHDAILNAHESERDAPTLKLKQKDESICEHERMILIRMTCIKCIHTSLGTL